MTRAGSIPNDALREAWRESGLSMRELARRVYNVDGEAARIGYHTRLRRALGLATYQKAGRTYVQAGISVELAQRVADGLHVAYADVGL